MVYNPIEKGFVLKSEIVISICEPEYQVVRGEDKKAVIAKIPTAQTFRFLANTNELIDIRDRINDEIEFQNKLAKEQGLSSELTEEEYHMKLLLKIKLTDIDFSVRALNCFKATDIETLSQLVVITKHDLSRYRNLGKKSLAGIEAKLESLKLSFGMDVSKYKL